MTALHVLHLICLNHLDSFSPHKKSIPSEILLQANFLEEFEQRVRKKTRPTIEKHIKAI